MVQFNRANSKLFLISVYIAVETDSPHILTTVRFHDYYAMLI